MNKSNQPKEIWFRKDLPSVMKNTQDDKQPSLDKILDIYSGVKYGKALGISEIKELKQAITDYIDGLIPDNKPDDISVSDVVNAHDEGWNAAIYEIRARLNGGMK